MPSSYSQMATVHLFYFCSLGGLGENTFYVDYRTEDGSANAGSDYEYSEGTLVFKPGETRKEIKVRKEKGDIYTLCTGCIC